MLSALLKSVLSANKKTDSYRIDMKALLFPTLTLINNLYVSGYDTANPSNGYG